MRRQSLLVALLLPTFLQGASAAEWPGFRGPGSDNTYHGETTLGEAGSFGLVATWEHDLGPGYSGVSVASGYAVTAFSDGTSDLVVAFDATSGEELWRHGVSSTHRGHDGSHDGPISTPLIAGERVFFLAPSGDFVALALATGERVWATHLIWDHGTMAPLYGFGSSPLLADGVLVVASGSQAGPPGTPLGRGPAFIGFDPVNGEVLWKAGQASITYQSPIQTTFDGRRLVLAASDLFLFGLEAKSGEILWQIPHEGEFYPAAGPLTMNPVPVGDHRFFVTASNSNSSVVELAPGEDGQMALSRVWTERSIRNTYAIPVYLNGYLYAYSSGFLTCVDATTGTSVWRSRKPGDGFPILVDGHLAIMTKKGSLHVAAASPEGYAEMAGLDLFETSWTPPSFADGRFYVRGLDGVAAVEARSAETAVAKAATAEPSKTGFARFLNEVAAASDKAKVVDRFLASQESFPLIEPGSGADGEVAVHFLYRGEADDLGIAGDMIATRVVEPMTRVEGTDLFYYSTRLLSDARISYYFVKDFEERLTDPRNPRTARQVTDKVSLEMTGEVSWVGMPRWQEPSHLGEAPEDRRGRIESVRIELPAAPDVPPGMASERQVDVYLPAGYDRESERRYPVVYVHGGNQAMELGGWTRSLDNLIGQSVEPVIVAFIYASSRIELTFGAENLYSKVFVEMIVPEIDRRYRTLATPESRGSVGADATGYAALFSALQYPGVIGKVAVQSAFLLTMQMGVLDVVMTPAGETAPNFYVEWGTYDSRSTQEAWDYREGSQALVKQLENRGYQVTASEVHDGFGWPAWRNHNDKILEWLFPLGR